MSANRFQLAIRKIAALASQGKELKAYLAMSPVKTEIVRASLLIARLDKNPALRNLRRTELDEAIKFLHLARMTACTATRTKLKADWKRSSDYFSEARRIASAIRVSIEKSDSEAILIQPSKTGKIGDGIETADGIPLVPSIMPVVFLSGSDRELGRQYAMQICGIFGNWILERKAGNLFSKTELEILAKWEAELATYAPEIIHFAEGMASGAQELGIKLSYQDALEIWTGVLPPETDYLGAGGLRMSRVPPLACSGVAAWGKATADGKLVTGSAGDFDPTFTVTMVVWPKTGNPFVYTPFGATGDVPALGSVNMFGHPGMNSKGLAYVHHGGTPKMIEPKAFWGYGLRRAPAVMHILRFADTAKKALEMELAFPVGDVGIDSGTCGGFWADENWGFVLESRKDPILFREAGLMGERDFLYSANSVLHPEAGQYSWLAKEQKKWTWDPIGGWTPKKFSFYHKLGLVYYGSAQRCKAFFAALNRNIGRVEFQTMVDCYKKGGTMPEGSWKAVSKAWFRDGSWGKLSPGNASNGILTFMKPGEGRYSVCIGQLEQGIAPTSPLFASVNPVMGGTYAFWDFHLLSTPDESLKRAALDAQNLAAQAQDFLKSLDKKNIAMDVTAEYLREANSQIALGFQKLRLALDSEGLTKLSLIASSTTSFLRSQVRSRQVLNQ